MNPAVLLIVGAAALAFAASRKKGNGGPQLGRDVTGTMPNAGTSPAPPPETGEQAAAEEAFVEIALDNVPMTFNLGQPGIDQGVIGMDADGFVHPTPDEWLSGWLTRISFWGAYPYAEGYPLQLPVECVLEQTCPEEFIPLRDAARRLNEMVVNGLINRGVPDPRYNPDTGLFDKG